MRINLKAIVISCMFYVFFASAIFDLSEANSGAAGIAKYLAITGLAAALITSPTKNSTNLFTFIGIIFFCLMTTFFTIINLSNKNSTHDLLVVSGYWVCAAIYIFASKNSNYLTPILKKTIIIFSFLFLIYNIVYLIDPSAYSLNKNQFKGMLSNPNALSGVCGLFFTIILVEFIFTRHHKFKLLLLFMLLLCTIYIFLAGSRGVILATTLSSLFILKKIGKLTELRTIFFITGFTLVTVYTLSTIQVKSIDREIFEETGRTSLLNQYLDRFSETYLLIGTGVSTEMGRIKSELSYPDVALFSGVGFLGFLVFLLNSLHCAIRITNNNVLWVASSFIYIAIISIFEGYAANIASIPSLLFYLLPAILHYNEKNPKILHSKI